MRGGSGYDRGAELERIGRVIAMTYSCELDSLLFREVDGSRWPAFERLFDCRGGPSWPRRTRSASCAR
jgi:hypothetical protein